MLVIDWTEQLEYLNQQKKEDRFIITATKEYKYADGRKLVGNQDVIDHLSAGKPISEATFFYNMQEAGVLNPEFTLTEFRQLNNEQQIKMIELGLKARPDVKVKMTE